MVFFIQLFVLILCLSILIWSLIAFISIDNDDYDGAIYNWARY